MRVVRSQIRHEYGGSPSNPVRRRSAADADGRRRTLAEQELVDSLGWLVAMRWFAGAGRAPGGGGRRSRVSAAAGPGVRRWTASACSSSPTTPGCGGGSAQLGARRTDSTEAYALFARAQIGLDWLAITLLTALSGGVESPAIIFFLFHISIAALLLPHARVFLYVAAGAAPGHAGGGARVRRRHAARGALRRHRATTTRCTRSACSFFFIGRLLPARVHLRGDLHAPAAAREGGRRALRERARHDGHARPADGPQPPGRVDHARPRVQGRGHPADRPEARSRWPSPRPTG